MKKPKLLIVEDEASILRGLEILFNFHDFEVTSESDGKQGLETALANEFDCILLDVMLPSLDGFSVCHEIRKRSNEQAIIMLTAKSSEEDIINGLTLGADDYLSKPFSVKELVLRVQSLLRRKGWGTTSSMLSLGPDIIVDCVNLTADVYGNKVEFTRREVDILNYLYANRRPVSRAELLEKVWGYNTPSLMDTRTVDIHIGKLRKKLEVDTKHPALLVTQRGEGYKLKL